MRVRASVVILAAVAATSAPAARAGGVPVQIVVAGSSLWTTSDSGVIRLDARSGRVLGRRPRAFLPNSLQVAVGGGAVWIASVANGYVAGALTRVDLTSGRATTRLRLADGPIFDVAVGGGAAWALVGPTRAARVARVDLKSGRQLGTVAGAVQPSWLAADDSGAWIVDARGLVHAFPSGRSERVARLRISGPPAIGLGSVWVFERSDLLRIDERTGRTIARVTLSGNPIAVAAGAGAAWVLTYQPPGRSALLRVGAASNAVTARRRVPVSSTSVAVGAGAVWVGVSGENAYVLRLDPRTLSLRTFAQLL